MSDPVHPSPMSDSVESILQNVLSNSHSNADDLVDTLNKLCVLINGKRDQIQLLDEYSSVPTLINFLSLPKLRTPSLSIIACACLDEQFVLSFIKNKGFQKLELAIDDTWDHHLLNLACLAMCRIFKHRNKHCNRTYFSSVVRLIPRIMEFLSTALELEFQMTGIRFCWMLLLSTPSVAKRVIEEANGLEILFKLLSSLHLELRMSAFRILIKLFNFSERENWYKDKVQVLLELTFENSPFSSFAYFCFMEESKLRHITEFLIHSGIVPKLYMQLSKSGCSDLKRLVLTSIRHLMPRLCTMYQREAKDLFQYYLENVLESVDQEFHALFVMLLYNIIIYTTNHHCTFAYEYITEFNLMDNLLNLLKMYICNSKCPCICSGELKEVCAIILGHNYHFNINELKKSDSCYFQKTLPPLTTKRVQQICSHFSADLSATLSSVSSKQASSQVLVHCQAVLPDKAAKNLNLITDDTVDELFQFQCLVEEYNDASKRLELSDYNFSDLILDFLKNLKYYPDQRCFIRKIVCHCEILIDYAVFNPSHSRAVLNIFSILLSEKEKLLQLILNEFVLKLELYNPNGFRMADAFPIEDMDECTMQCPEMHYASIQKLTSLVQKALNTKAVISYLILRNRNKFTKDEKLLVVHAAVVLVSNKASLQFMLLDNEGLKFLMGCLSDQNPKTQKIAAVAVSELFKFFTYSEPYFSMVPRDQIFRNWHPHSEFSPCCYRSLKISDSNEPKQAGDSVGRPGCQYSESAHDVKFYVKGVEDSIGANREMICSRSEYFKGLLLGNFIEKESSTIFLQNIMKRSLVFIFHFLHGCTTNSSCDYQSDISLLEKLDLIINCDYFLLSDLKVIVENLLFDNLCCKNIPVIYEYLKVHSFPTLAVKAVSEALSIGHHSDYWSCFQELVSLDLEFSFLADVKNLLMQRLQS